MPHTQIRKIRTNPCFHLSPTDLRGFFWCGDEIILQIEGLFQEKCVILNFTSHMKTKIDEQY